MDIIEGIWKPWYKYEIPKTTRRHHPPTIEGLLAHTKQDGECRIWLGTTDDWGYGRKTINKKKVRVHRLMWMLVNGPIPADKILLHSCDRPPCIEIAHLSLGTDKDNYDDMVRKGRRALALSGENHPEAKLTKTIVKQIKAYKGKLSGPATAKLFKIHSSTVYRVWNNINWVSAP